MTYIRIQNAVPVEYPVYEGDIRLRYSNVSFPSPFIPPDEYELVKDVVAPEFDYRKNVKEGPPTSTEGVWVRNWLVTDATPEEIKARTEHQWASVREKRNFLLAECDWTQLPDAPLANTQTAEWATYRQDLRDITGQENPFSITWPEKPE